MTAVRDVLIAARARVAQGWCQGWFSRDAAGVQLYCINDPSAVSWCSSGAIKSQCLDSAIEDKALGCLFKILDTYCIADWNDDPCRTQADVLALYDRAIEAAP